MTDGRLARVANQPKTPQRSVRVPDEVYLAAKAKAEADGETVSDVIRRCLDMYVKHGHGVKDADFMPPTADG